MRKFGAWLVFLTLVLSVCSAADRVVDLDAQTLSGDKVPVWANGGTLGGGFEAVKTGGATVEVVDGRKAVTFDGKGDYLRSSFTASAGITGDKPFSVAVRVYNPKVNAGEEPLVYWAHRGDGSRTAHLNYGDNKSSGAVVHWGGDMGYNPIPQEAKWHMIVLTYAGGKGGVENLYVDGKLNNTGKKSLNLFPGDPIYLGTTDLEKFFSGSISEVRIFDRALSEAEVAALDGNGDQKLEGALVNLAAENLPEGRLTEWPNRGSLGGNFGLETAAPKLQNIDGNPAVVFGNRSWLQSQDTSSLAGAFSVEYWVYRPELNDIACPVLSWGGAKNGEQARFGYAKAPKDGALIYSKERAGYEYPAPAAKKWHHIAYTGNADGLLKIYIDGELEKELKVSAPERQQSRFQLGAAWAANRTTPITAPEFALSKLRVYNEAISQREIRNNEGLFNAFAPNPSNKGQSTGFEASLSWSEGDTGFKGADVYFGEDKAAIESADKSSKLYKGKAEAGKSSFGPVPVDLEKTYYWRVDELGNDSSVACKGEVWSFKSESGKASEPRPRTDVAAVPVKTNSLSWVPGKYATKQTVYLSADKAEVESGKAVIAKGLKATEKSCKLGKIKLDYGKTYYWRVSSENGSHSPSTGDVWSFRTEDKLAWNDITFMATSDLHYGTGPTNVLATEATIDFMNNLPGNPYPKEVGGTIMTPRGVVLTGDLTNDGNQDQWDLFVKDWGVNGEGRIAYPVYEGWGNHDGSLAPGKVVATGIAQRNKTRVGVKNVSENGFHYSWDWDQLHMIDLNLYAGDVRIKHGSMDGPGHEPQFSLKFLKEDLAKNVGTSGRPVFIMMHLGFDEGFSIGWSWWAAEERDAFYEAIKDYNVIGVLYGHTHAAANYKWKGIDIYNCASSQRDPDPGECLVFHVTPKELVVAHRFKDRWGDVWRMPINGLADKK